jgi:hypothetical protein
MSDKEITVIKDWIANWQKTGPMLERLSIEEYRAKGLAATLLSLSDVTTASLLAHPPKPTSGIIEMQRLFAKMRENEASS